MNHDSESNTVLICCSLFEAEVESLRKMYWPHLECRYIDSKLHLKPEQLAIQLELLVEEELGQGHHVVLVYGDCCTRMAALETRCHVTRTRGNNCCDLLLGRDEYRRLSHAGAFFMFPEWSHRWHEIFSVELGLSAENAACLMQDMHSKLVYLDTGLIPAPKNDLQACAQYCGLPYEVLPVSLDHLYTAIQDALLQLECTLERA